VLGWLDLKDEQVRKWNKIGTEWSISIPGFYLVLFFKLDKNQKY
jgi:hypothetical protein